MFESWSRNFFAWVFVCLGSRLEGRSNLAFAGFHVRILESEFFCLGFCLFRQQPLLQVQLRVLQPWGPQRQEQGRQQGQELAWVALPILKVPGQKWPHHT